MDLFEAASFTLLRNGWAEVRRGIILAGVDDLTARRRNGQGGDPIMQALMGLPVPPSSFHIPLGRPKGRRKPEWASCYQGTPTEGKYGHSTIWSVDGILYWKVVTKCMG